MKLPFLRLISLLLVTITVIFATGCDMSHMFEELDAKQKEKFQDFTTKKTEQSTLKQTDTSKGSETVNMDNIALDLLNFDGMTLNILVHNDKKIQREWYGNGAEELLATAVEYRNSAVTDKLNLNATYFEGVSGFGLSQSSSFSDMIVNDVISAKHQYDISAHSATLTASLAIRDCAANFLDEDTFPYFNFNLSCWNKSLIANTTVNEKLYYLAGDLNFSVFDSAAVVWYNDTLYQSKKSSSDPDDLQSFALAGKWDYDDLYGWITRFDGGSPAFSANAKSPLLINSNSGFLSGTIPSAWQLNLMTRDTADAYRFNINGNTKAENALTKYKRLLNDTGVISGASNVFTSKKAVFYMSELYESESTNESIHSMSNDYALLPFPKYNSDQQEYKTSCSDTHSLIMALDHSRGGTTVRGAAISAFLQTSSEHAYSNVRINYYYDIACSSQSSDDDNNTDIEIFNLIVDSIDLSFMNIYSPQLNGAYYLWETAAQNSSLATAFNEDYTAYANSCDDTAEWLCG